MPHSTDDEDEPDEEEEFNTSAPLASSSTRCDGPISTVAVSDADSMPHSTVAVSDAAMWQIRHGGIEWSREKRVASRSASGGGIVFAFGPEVPTSGSTLIRLRILQSNAQWRCSTHSIPANSGHSMSAGVAYDSLHGIGISLELDSGRALQFPVVVLNSRPTELRLPVVVGGGNQTMQEGYCTARRCDIAGRVLEIAIDARELRMAWQGDEARPLPIPALPDHVRPFIKLFGPLDSIELLSISIRRWPGAALAFALALMRISQRSGILIPDEIASRIWNRSIQHG